MFHIQYRTRLRPGTSVEPPGADLHVGWCGEPWVQIWMGIILICITMALLMERYLPNPPEKLVTFAQNHRRQVLHLFQVLVGLAMLLTAVKGAILAPHLSEMSLFGLLLRFVQGGIGVLFIANFAVRLGAALMVALFLASTGLFGFITSLESCIPGHCNEEFAIDSINIGH